MLLMDVWPLGASDGDSAGASSDAAIGSLCEEGEPRPGYTLGFGTGLRGEEMKFHVVDTGNSLRFVLSTKDSGGN